MPDRNELFVRLFAANQRRIYGYIVAMIPRTSDVDDVFQDVSMSLWRKFDEFSPGTDFAAWALRFARYGVLKHYEKQARLGRFVFDETLINLIADEAAVESARGDRRLDALRECLEKLPERSRTLLRFRYESGLKTCTEVADRVGRSVDATYKALSRVHRRLLDCVQRRLLAEESG
jgi:RNA polymerase sigma-70 factor (ECF subfamily)